MRKEMKNIGIGKLISFENQNNLVSLELFKMHVFIHSCDQNNIILSNQILFKDLLAPSPLFVK